MNTKQNIYFLYPFFYPFILATMITFFFFSSAVAQPDQGTYQERVTTRTNERDNDFLDKLQGQQFKRRGFTPEKNNSSTEQTQSLFYFVNKKFEIKAEVNLKSKAYITTVQTGDKVELIYLVKDHGASKITWTKIYTNKGEEGFIPEEYIQKDKPDVRVLPPAPIYTLKYAPVCTGKNPADFFLLPE